MPIDGYQLCVAYASSSNSCYIIKCNQQGLPKKKNLMSTSFHRQRVLHSFCITELVHQADT